jgi:hypothetical protein
MLPGFRFLFAAIVLSISILVFGLGAAALLRAAHEEVASNPGWHAAPDATFAQQAEVARPVLAMLRVDPLPAQLKAPDAAAAASPAEQVTAPAPTGQAAEVPVPAEREATVSAPVEPETVATLKPEETSEPVAAKPEIPAAESPAPSEAANSDAVANHIKIASAEQSLPPADDASSVAPETAPAASTQTPAQVSPQPSIASTKIAALGDPAATEPQPRANTNSATPDRSIIRKRQQARRAAQRRRMALLRARQAQLALQQQQQAGDLFSQPQPPVQPPVPARKN